MPPTFFVCYRREDAGYAAALSGALAQRHGSDRVFKDITSLRPADDWRAEVAAAIGRATHVLVLVGPHWMAGVDPHGRRNGRPDPIAFEVTEALRTRRTVVPVLLGRAQMPLAHHLPYALAGLPDLNAAYIRTESADADIATLVDRLPQPAPVRERPRAREAVSSPRPPARSPVGRIVGGLVAVALLGTLAWVGVTLWDKTSGLLPGPPGASSNGPGATRRLTLSPTSGTMKTHVKATATGFTPGTQVRFSFHADDLPPDATVGPDGSVSTSFTVPEFYGHFPGRQVFTVSVRELNSANSATADFVLNN